ncbi:MAG TPA: PAS domain S-box protein, partial [Ardenticatenaceae bacterium]|nr:PAS domain S-box protein [Ardenticatenaceae bacterium]
LDGVIVEINPAYCQMHGYERDELIGRHLTELIHPDYRHVLASTVKATSAGREYQTEGVNLRKDGSPLYVEARGTSFTYRGQPHILAIVRDITERKRAEAQVREKEEQYRSVFEASSDGLVVNDRDTGVVVAVNPAFARMHGYTVEELLGRDPTAFVHPDSYHLFADYLETVKAGREFRTQAVDIRKDGTPFPIEVHGTGFTYLGKPHCLGVVRDITERVQAYQLLERRVAERTRELATLLEVSHTLASTLELKPLLRLILDQLKVVADHSRASILLLEGDDLRVLDATWSAELAESQAINELSFSRERLGPIWEAICRQEPFILQDVWADDPMAEAFRAAAGEHYASHFRQVRAWLAVPLVVKNEVTGFLALSSTEPDYYTSHHADLALAVAQQAAIAIENARLYRQAQEEARKTAALARVASSVALGGSLETALTEVAGNVVEASGAVASSMTLADGELPRLSLLGTYGLPEGYGEGIEAINRGGTWLLSAAGYYDPDPLVMRDVRQRLLANPAYAPIHRFLHQVPWDMLVSLPMVYQERHLGRLNLYYPPGREPGEDELAFLAAIASQAATAVENARLYDQAQALAALEERQRLARELHDSVSQALYGIALGARTARTLLDRDPSRLAEPLDYVLSLAEAGLTEMRALIFALR